MPSTTPHKHFCHLCPCKYTAKHNLQEHIRIKHLGSCPFQCPHTPCLRSFSHKHHLKRHIQSVHERSTKRQCQCGRVFSRWSSYERHLKRQAGAGCAVISDSSPSISPESQHATDTRRRAPSENLNTLHRKNTDERSDNTGSSMESATFDSDLGGRNRLGSIPSTSATSIMSIGSIIDPIPSPEVTTSASNVESTWRHQKSNDHEPTYPPAWKEEWNLDRRKSAEHITGTPNCTGFPWSSWRNSNESPLTSPTSTRDATSTGPIVGYPSRSAGDALREIWDRIDAISQKVRTEQFASERWGQEHFDRVRHAIDLVDKLL